MNKVIHDFLTYEYTNLIWSSLNTVLCIMPLICLFVINRKLPDDLDLENSKMSYAILLVVVCLANVFQFAFKPRLFYPVFKKKLFSKSESSDLLLHQDDDQLNQSVIESSLIKGEDDKDHHYVWMKQQFVTDRAWLWIVNVVVYVVVITVYFCVPGQELSF